MIRRVNPTEHQIQAAIVEWARSTNFTIGYKIGDFLIKQANEGKRSLSLGKKMKKEGLIAGVSDLFLAIPSIGKNKENGDSHFFGGMFIEVKSATGRLSYKQGLFIGIMSKYYVCAIVNSVDEGIQAIKDYLGMV